MITPTNTIVLPVIPGRTLKFTPDLGLLMFTLNIPAGHQHIAYEPMEDDYLSQGITDGEYKALSSVTIIAPGGKIQMTCDRLVATDGSLQVIEWEGSLKPMCNGIFIKATSIITAIEDSVFHCISPHNNSLRFDGKILKRIHLETGESYTFGSMDIGFGVVWGADTMTAYNVEPDDVFTATEPTVLALSSWGTY